MAGELVPLVMFARYTVLAGEGSYSTIGMDVTEYQSSILNGWRGAVLPPAGSGTYELVFEESTDQVVWTACTVVASGGGTAPWDPGAGQEEQFTATLRKRWFRVRVVLGGSAAAVVTTWLVGFLELRER
jgi:hypothetical protein